MSDPGAISLPGVLKSYRAYFADNKNIGSIPVLIDIATSVNLPGQEAEKVLESRAFKGSVERDWARSHELGVMAVPTFLINGQRMVGAQPYESLERLLRDNGVKSHRPKA